MTGGFSISLFEVQGIVNAVRVHAVTRGWRRNRHVCKKEAAKTQCRSTRIRRAATGMTDLVMSHCQSQETAIL